MNAFLDTQYIRRKAFSRIFFHFFHYYFSSHFVQWFPWSSEPWLVLRILVGKLGLRFQFGDTWKHSRLLTSSYSLFFPLRCVSHINHSWSLTGLLFGAVCAVGLVTTSLFKTLSIWMSRDLLLFMFCILIFLDIRGYHVVNVGIDKPWLWSKQKLTNIPSKNLHVWIKFVCHAGFFPASPGFPLSHHKNKMWATL